MGKTLVKPSLGRVWGEIGTPKGFLGTMETIPLAQNPGKPRGGPIPPQSYLFRAPFWGPKKSPGLPRPTSGVGGPGSKNIKVRESKTMQNPLVNAPNGAICCKLWPQTILGVGAPNFGEQPLPIRQPLCPRGNPSAPGVMKASRRPLCGMGHPSGLG